MFKLFRDWQSHFKTQFISLPDLSNGLLQLNAAAAPACCESAQWKSCVARCILMLSPV